MKGFNRHPLAIQIPQPVDKVPRILDEFLTQENVLFTSPLLENVYRKKTS